MRGDGQVGRRSLANGATAAAWRTSSGQAVFGSFSRNASAADFGAFFSQASTSSSRIRSPSAELASTTTHASEALAPIERLIGNGVLGDRSEDLGFIGHDAHVTFVGDGRKDPTAHAVRHHAVVILFGGLG
jgi:hypothetical protein